MAVVKYTVIVGPNGTVPAGVMVATWANLATGDTGTPLMASGYPDKTGTMAGTIGTSTALFEGSPDGTLWQTIKDVRGTALSYTTLPKQAVVEENTRFIRPSVTGGAGATVTFTATCSSPGVQG